MEQISLDIGTIGQKLEAARQEKGVSVSAAGQETKILSKYIEAMEADNFEVISAPVYIKGFIRIYAEYLGLDADSLIEEYSGRQEPQKKTPLPDELKQNLAKADRIEGDEPRPSGKKAVFSKIHNEVGNLPLSPKTLAIAGGGVVLLIVLVIILSNLGSKEQPAANTPTQTDVPIIPREQLYKESPNVYISEPGKIDVEK